MVLDFKWCSVCSMRVKFNIDLSFREIRRLYWIKFIIAYIHAERERIRKSSWKEFWKFQVNETKFGSVFLVKCINICIKFLMYEILLWPLNLVFTIFTIKIKLLKSCQKCFVVYQKALFVLEIYKFLYFTFPLFFSFLVIAEVDW